MKCLCFSDSHGSVDLIVRALRIHRDAEVVFFLGDGLSDIAHFVMNDRERAWLTVRGNCDMSASLFGNTVKKTDEITLLDKRIVYTHGDLYGAKYGKDGLISLGCERCADIVLFGHTHVPHESYISDGGFYLFNPGSAGGVGTAPSYGVISITDKGVLLSHGTLA